MEKIKNGIATTFKFTNLLSYSNTSTCVGVSRKKLSKRALVLIDKANVVEEAQKLLTKAGFALAFLFKRQS